MFCENLTFGYDGPKLKIPVGLAAAALYAAGLPNEIFTQNEVSADAFMIVGGQNRNISLL